MYRSTWELRCAAVAPGTQLPSTRKPSFVPVKFQGPAMMWPTAVMDDVGATVIDFGRYKGTTFWMFLSRRDMNYVLWFLAHDINSGQLLRRCLWQFFNVLREDGCDHLIIRASNEKIYSKLHSPEGFVQEPLPQLPPRPAGHAPSPPEAAPAPEIRRRRDPEVGAEAQPCRYWMIGKGCRDLVAGTCRREHPDKHDGTNLLDLNRCHRFGRSSCGDQQFCRRIHKKTDMDMLTFINQQMRIAQGLPVIGQLNGVADLKAYNLGYYLADTLERYSHESRAALLSEIITTFNNGALLEPVHGYLMESVAFAQNQMDDDEDSE